MANPNYHWIKTEHVDAHQPYTFGDPCGQNSTVRRPVLGPDGRSQSSSSMTSSSLRGAVGDMHISSQSQSQYSGSPSPTSDGSKSQHRTRPYDVASGMVWINTPSDMSTHPSMHAGGYSDATEQVPMSFHGMSSPATSVSSGSPTNPYVHYQDYNTTAYSNPSAASHSSAYQSYPDFDYQQARAQSPLGVHPMITPPSATFPPTARHMPPNSMTISSRPARTPEEEVRQLRTRVRELELINDSARLRIRELENELANPMQGSYATSSISGLPSPLPTPTVSSAFAASWKARTDARVKLFCSLNRAGNALCAWHDSRRERRAHPPRMAPPGHLNCGCTYEEALFEESLARHGVGSYHPGENVRMDPALRNPLLKLLQQRFGYRDGDFERDSTSGHWVEGEGHAPWEAKVLSGASSHRKYRTEERR